MDTEAAARRWRDVWERAWPEKDPDAIDALYTRDAVYRSHPFREPEPTPRDYVERMFAEEDEIECRFGEPIVAGDRAAVEWWATWREDDEQLTLAGATVLRFTPDGLVAEHLDYWVEGRGKVDPLPGWGLAAGNPARSASHDDSPRVLTSSHTRLRAVSLPAGQARLR